MTISAPGEDSESRVDKQGGRSCIVSSIGILSLTRGGGTDRLQGTSQAAPHLSGVVALISEAALAAPLNLEQTRTRIRSSAVRAGVAPLDPAIATCQSSPVAYTFDGEREGILWAPGAVL